MGAKNVALMSATLFAPKVYFDGIQKISEREPKKATGHHEEDPCRKMLTFVARTHLGFWVKLAHLERVGPQ